MIKDIFFHGFGCFLAFLNYPVSLTDKWRNGDEKLMLDFTKAIENLFEYFRKEKNIDSRNNSSVGDGSLYPHIYFNFSRFFDVSIISLSSSNSIPLHYFRRYELIKSNEDFACPSNGQLDLEAVFIEDINLNKHVIWGGLINLEDNNWSTVNDQFNHTLSSSPLVAIMHIKFRNEFLMLDNPKENLKSFISELISEKSKIFGTNHKFFVQQGHSYSELALIIPTNSYKNAILFSKALRRQEFSSVLNNGQNISKVFRTFTTLGINAKCFTDNSLNLLDEISNESINVVMEFTIKSGVDESKYARKLMPILNNSNNGTCSMSEGKEDILFSTLTTTKDYVMSLNRLLVEDKLMSGFIMNLKTTISIPENFDGEEMASEPLIKESFLVDSELNSSIVKKYFFSVNDIEEIENALSVCQVPYPIRQYVINIYNSFNNHISDRYEYINYLDLYDFLKAQFDRIKEYNSPQTSFEEIQVELEGFYEIIRVAYENRLFSSYYVGLELGEINLLYNGGIAGRLMTLSWIYKSVAEFINPEKKAFITVEHRDKITFKHNAFSCVLNTNFTFLHRIEILFGVLLSEVTLPKKFKDDDRYIGKNNGRNISDDFHNHLLGDYHDILRSVFFNHIVKDYLMYNFVFKNGTNDSTIKAFSFWNMGVYLSDRQSYDRSSKGNVFIDEVMLKDIVLRQMIVYMIAQVSLDDYEFPFYNNPYLHQEEIDVIVSEAKETAYDIKRSWLKSVRRFVKKKEKEIAPEISEIFKRINHYLLSIYRETYRVAPDKVYLLERNIRDGHKKINRDYGKILFDLRSGIDYSPEFKPRAFSLSSELMYDLSLISIRLRDKWINQ